MGAKCLESLVWIYSKSFVDFIKDYFDKFCKLFILFKNFTVWGNHCWGSYYW